MSIINIETSGFDSESSYSENSNNYDYEVESIDFYDPEVTQLEVEKPLTEEIEIVDEDPEVTHVVQEEGMGGRNVLIDSIGLLCTDPKQFFVSALATVGNAGVAITSGIGKVSEGIYDALHMTGAAVLTPITGIYDFFGNVTGGDNKLTERMWDNAKNTVSKTIVDETLDSYYSEYGKNMNENAATGFKRGETGYSILQTGGEVLGTLATAQGVTGSSVFSKTGSNTAAVVAGIKGFGQGVEEAYNNGASHFDAFSYGIFSGAFDTAQWVGGAKVNSIQIGKGLVGKYGSIATRVVLDGLDGAADTPVRSFYDTAYNGKSYIENFNNRGGIQSIIQGFFTGAGFSAISEFIQLKTTKDTDTIKKSDNSGVNLKEISKMKNDELFLFLKNNLDNNNLKKYLEYVDIDSLGIILPQMDDSMMKKIILLLEQEKFDNLYSNVDNELRQIISKNDFRPSNPAFYNKIIEITISTIDDELGNGSGIEKLKNLVKTGDYSQITEKKLIRQNLQGVPIEDIKKYLDEYDLKKSTKKINDMKIFETINNSPKNKEIINKSLEDFKLYNYSNAYEELGGLRKNLEAYWELILWNKKNSINMIDILKDENISPEIRQEIKYEFENTSAGKTVAKLTTNEFEICNKYSGEAYRSFNNQLRGIYSDSSEEFLKNITNGIDSSILKQDGISEDILLFRKTKISQFQNLIIDENIKSLEGQVFMDKAYMSTTVAKEFYNGDYDTIITIKTPKGTKLLNMMGISGNAEGEFLLARNSSLYFEKVDVEILNGKKQYNIIATLLMNE